MVLVSVYFTIGLLFSTYVGAKSWQELANRKKKKEAFIDEIQKHGRHHELNVKNTVLTNECLFDENSAKEILRDSNITKVDINTRFILGKCNPVILVPGVFGTRLVIRIKCSEFLKDKQKAFETKYFCGEKICKPSVFSKNDEEEYVLWPSLFETPFKLYEDEENHKNSCFGYFMQYYNSPEECPEMEHKPDSKYDNEKYICRYHPAVKITYYGGTNNTMSDSICGLRAIENIVASGMPFIKDTWVNQGPSVGFYGLHNRFYDMGYRPGFSLAGLPYDFRRYIFASKEFSKNFNNLVETLYNNTGKQVIIIGHSYGNLHSLNKLVEIHGSDLSKKIKRFVAIAPPFTGSPKAIETMTTGTREFKTVVVGMTIDINIYAQRLYSTTTPSSYELMISPQIEKILENKEFLGLIEALSERINLENTCNFKNCTKDEITKLSNKFSNVFPYFPKLNETICEEEDMNSTKYKDLQDYEKLYNDDIYKPIPRYSKCKLRMFDYLSCPVVVYSDQHERDIKKYLNFCNQTTGKEFFVRKCEFKNSKEDKQCLIEFLKNEGMFGYSDMNSTQGIYETKEKHKKNIQKFYEHKIMNDKISTFPHPEIPTTLIFSSFLNTRAGFLYQQGNETFQLNSTNIFFYGGDGTVPSISPLFAGFKWAYERNLNKSKPGVQFVEYCSILHKDGKYGYKKFDNISEENQYIALGCECLNGDTLKLETFQKSKCSHSTMINDDVLIQFVENIVSLEPQYNQLNRYKQSIREAIKYHNISDIDYEHSCNERLNY